MLKFRKFYYVLRYTKTQEAAKWSLLSGKSLGLTEGSRTGTWEKDKHRRWGFKEMSYTKGQKERKRNSTVLHRQPQLLAVTKPRSMNLRWDWVWGKVGQQQLSCAFKLMATLKYSETLHTTLWNTWVHLRIMGTHKCNRQLQFRFYLL